MSNKRPKIFANETAKHRSIEDGNDFAPLSKDQPCSSKYPRMLTGTKIKTSNNNENDRHEEPIETQTIPNSRKRRIQLVPNSDQPQKLLRRSPSVISDAFSMHQFEYEVKHTPQSDTSGIQEPCIRLGNDECMAISFDYPSDKEFKNGSSDIVPNTVAPASETQKSIGCYDTSLDNDGLTTKSRSSKTGRADEGIKIVIEDTVATCFSGKRNRETVRSYQKYENGDISIGEVHFRRAKTRSLSIQYQCRACVNAQIRARRAKQPKIPVGILALDTRTNIIHGNPNKPGGKAHACGATGISYISSGSSIKRSDYETDNGKMIAVAENIAPILRYRKTRKVVRVYRKFQNDDIKVNGFIFKAKHCSGICIFYSCKKCTQIAQLARYAKKPHIMVGTIVLDPRTNIIHGDPNKPSGEAHVCGATGISQNTSGNSAQHDDENTDDTDAETINGNLPELDASSFEKELENPTTIYTELREFRNTIKEAYAGDNLTNMCVYILFTRRHGTIQEMIKSVFLIGKTNLPFFHEIANLKVNQKIDAFEIAGKSEIWITTLPLGALSDEAAADCQILFDFFVSVNRSDADPDHLISQTIAKVKNPVLSHALEELEAEGFFAAALIQVLHAAMRITYKFYPLKETDFK